MSVDYTFSHDLEPIWGGDSLPDLSFLLTKQSDEPIVPAQVCAQILSRYGEQLYEWDVSIDPDGVVLLGKMYDTSMLREGKFRYTVTYILEDGRRRTYFDGVITIMKRVPKCKGRF